MIKKRRKKKLKISNHIIFNYTGKTIEVFDIESGYSKINRIEVQIIIIMK